MILTILNLQQLKFSQLCAFDISGWTRNKEHHRISQL
jgi:hypothetical protein